MNVDGISSASITNVDIPKKDSLFVFVAVTVNPNNQNNPLIIRDSVVFEVNGNTQSVGLEAWGQDAYFYTPNVFPTNGLPPYHVISCNDVWKNDKPHVIYGYAVVDSDCKLSIEPGTKVYMHSNGVLWVFNKGTLVIQGSYNNPVTFQGDRLEADYAQIPGQWGKIWLSAGSQDNIIDWALIKNGGIGVQADTLGASTNPTLRLSNTIIENMSAAALYAQGSYIQAYNCVFANCAQYVAALTLGGNYSFWQCTFADYWNYSGNRQTPLLVLNNWYTDNKGTLQIRNLDTAYFGNCILYGNLPDEIGLDSTSHGGNFNYKFEYSLLHTSLNTSNTHHFKTVYINSDPLFINSAGNDYRLSPGSPAIKKGSTAIGKMFPFDLNKHQRLIGSGNIPPDLGAYQFQ